MCQIVPFSLPCCRRVYVEVSKLPSCPNSWPNRKCPPELCIQVRGFEAEYRESGKCWRCIAKSSGAIGHHRVVMRPKIDGASLVLGLEEIGVSGRRMKTERDGECWFCGAQGGCKSCGAKDIVELKEDEKPEITGFKKKRRKSEGNKGKEVGIKRAKIERTDSQIRKPPTSAFKYPVPNTASQSQQPHPQLHHLEMQTADQVPRIFNEEFQCSSQDFRAANFPHDGLPTMGDSAPFLTNDAQESFMGNWQAVNNQQNTAPGPYSLNPERYPGYKLFGCGHHTELNPQCRAVEPFTCPVPGDNSNVRSELQQGRCLTAGSVHNDHQEKVGQAEDGWKRVSNPQNNLVDGYTGYPDPSVNLQLQGSTVNESNTTGLITTNSEQDRMSNYESSKLRQLHWNQNAERSDPSADLQLRDTHIQSSQPRSSTFCTLQYRISDESSQGSMPPQHSFYSRVQYSPKIDPVLQDAQQSVKHGTSNDNSGCHQVNNEESDHSPQYDFDQYTLSLNTDI
ncbi:unnamed protein product [Diplocarpon coronariae]